MDAYIYEYDKAGIIEARGKEALDLMNRLSTNDLAVLHPGEARETIFTNEKGRIIDVPTVLAFDGYIWLLTSPGMDDTLMRWLDKYTIMEDVKYTLRSEEYRQFYLYTNGSIDSPPESHLWRMVALEDEAGLSIAHESICGPGARILVQKGYDGDEWSSRLAERYGAELVDESEWNLHRVRNGWPRVGNELSEKTNPLECAAWQAVDFRKGCYIGQEVIARLDSYNKVQRHLAELSFAELPDEFAPGMELSSGGGNAGFLTSVAHDPETDAFIALGCVRTAFLEPGTEVHVAYEGREYVGKIVRAINPFQGSV